MLLNTKILYLYGNIKTSFFLEKKLLCFQMSDKEIDKIDDIKSNTEFLSEDKVTLEDLQNDTNSVEQALQSKLEGWVPLKLSMAYHDSIFEGTSAERGTGASWIIGEKTQKLWEGSIRKFKTINDATKIEYNRLIKSEIILSEVIDKSEKKKTELINRKKTLIKALESSNKMRSKFNLRRYVHPGDSFQKWRFKQFEIKGEYKKIKILKDKKRYFENRKKKIEKAIEKKLMPHKETRKNIISFLETAGLDKKKAELIFRGISLGKVNIGSSGEKDAALIGTEAPYDSLIPISYWENMGTREKEILIKTVERYQEKGGEMLQAFETSKSNVEKFKEFKKIGLEYASNKIDEDFNLPKINIEGESLEAGKYHSIHRDADLTYYVRIDDKKNNEKEPLKNIIAYNQKNRKWEFVKDFNSLKTNQNTKDIIKTKVTDKIKKDIEDKIDNLEQTFNKLSSDPTKTQILKSSLQDLEKKTKEFGLLDIYFDLKTIPSTTFKKFNKLKTDIDKIK